MTGDQAVAPAQLVAPAHPWRRTARTVLAVVLALLPMLPAIADQLGVAAVPVVASLLALAAAVTRVLAMPQVEVLLRRFVPWLAAGDVDARHVVTHVVDNAAGEPVIVAGEDHVLPTGTALVADRVLTNSVTAAVGIAATPRRAKRKAQ